MKDAATKRSIQYLKQAYDGTDIPRDVYHRVRFNITEPKVARSRRRRLPQLSLIVVAACWLGAVLTLFLFYALKAEKIPGSTDRRPRLAKIILASGHTEVRKNNDTQPAKTGMYLDDQSTVRTFSNNAVIQIGRHRIKIDKQTSFGIRSVSTKKMSFALARGAAEFNVAKLEIGSTLTIQSGELKVSVVGTVFRVDRTESCASVRVMEGRVKTEFEDQTVYISAGGRQEFCEKSHQAMGAARDLVQRPQNAATTALLDDEQSGFAAPEKSAVASDQSVTRGAGRQGDRGQKSRLAKKTAHMAKDLRKSGDQFEKSHVAEADAGLRVEEQLIKKAHGLIAQNKRQAALEYLGNYIINYPDGLFAEEALFNAVRQSYWLKRMNDVINYSGIFLDRGFQTGYKSTEIRIIRAQALLEQNENPLKALDSLEPAMPHLEKVSARYRGQAMYLFVLAAQRAKKHQTCHFWARQYLEQFPDGRYADPIEKIVSKKIIPE